MKNTKKIISLITECMLDKKASGIKVIHVNRLTSLTDTFIVCTSDSDPQTKAIANHIKESLSKENLKAWHTEGFQHLNWVLIDYVNVVVNIFSKEAREYYDLERLWADAKIESIN
tara:strand:- start:191 stop:535 length:345 start_codon:yes stop_codon:yes gene_type:complete